MQKIKPETLKQMLQRTGLPRQELANKLGLKTPSIFFKWMENGKIPEDRLTMLNQILDAASGSANPAAGLRSATRFASGPMATTNDLAHIPDKDLIEELQRRLEALSSKGKG